MTDSLPDSGEPGVRPPTPADLPRPAMWPAGAEQAPFSGVEEDTDDPPSPARRRLAFVAIAVVIVGVVLLGVAVARLSWPFAVAGALVAAVGGVAAVRLRVMEDVSVSDDPHG